jgi:hypothetical protein
VRAAAADPQASSLVAAAAHRILGASVQMTASSGTPTPTNVVIAGAATLTTRSHLAASVGAGRAGAASLLATAALAAVAPGEVICRAAGSLAATPTLLPAALNASAGLGATSALRTGEAGYLGSDLGQTFNTFLFDGMRFDGPEVTLFPVPAAAALFAISSLLSAVGEVIELPGGCGPCHKPPLPHHPKPSIADYTPQNIAPLIEFFRPIVSGVLGRNIGLCQVEFRYENNTPCICTDDLYVHYPTCPGDIHKGWTNQNYPVPYTPKPRPHAKSKEQLLYESYAKRSVALYNYMINSPARIKYFDGDMQHQILPY